MSTVRLIFCRTKGGLATISTPILRFVAWSPWSHVALVMEDGQSVIDATFLHKGVTQRPLSDVLAESSVHAFRDIECPNPQAAYGYARSQIGKPYDWLGCLGLALHRDWQSDDSWWCSEFVEACIAKGGNARFVNNPQRVTQQHSWIVR